ncbi:MAG: phage portal protein [Anaerolineae bacterium]|nr:phage portal protein [Anaerolineae bacterium]
MVSVTEQIQEREAQVSEIIGRSATEIAGSSLYAALVATSAIDNTIPDYAWWDAFRRGTKRGFEFAGLFARPITQVISGWAMGKALTANLVENDGSEDAQYTERLINKFLARSHSMLVQVVEDLYALGDQYLVVNVDGSISVVSPDLVKPEYDLFDYRKLIRCTITSKFDSYTISDIYTASERTVRVNSASPDVQQTLLAQGFVQVKPNEYENVYPNLIGRIPVIHWHNDRGTNERRGRPIYEAMYRLFERYNQLLSKMIEGAQLMGNPIPVFEGVKDTKKTIDANSTSAPQTYVDASGVKRERRMIEWDKLPALFLGEGGRFVLVSPQGGFTEDIRATLKSLFLLIMEFTRIPDGLWGAELGSARATLEEQMRAFEMFITSRRMMLQGEGADEELGVEANGGLLELISIWLMTRALTDRRVRVAPMSITFEPLSSEDKQLLLEKVKWAKEALLVTDATALGKLDLVEDPEAELEAARQESDERGDPYERAVDDLLAATQQQQPAQEQPDGADLADEDTEDSGDLAAA